jgi:Tol biopolymer transport system component
MAFNPLTHRIGDDTIWGMDASGGKRRVYARGTRFPEPAVWSPDGHYLAYVTSLRLIDTEIFVTDIQSGRSRNLTRHEANDFSPSWSPDGQRIAFVSDRDGDTEIYVMDTDGNNLHRLTVDSGYNFYPAWSPDGHFLIYSSYQKGNNDLLLMDMGCLAQPDTCWRHTEHLATTALNNIHPDWSPDGRYLALEVVEAGKPGGIYVLDMTDRTLRQINHYERQFWNPVWMP